ncbi:nucleotidyltransferase family protein [Microbacterium profundi]|uniref:nucleotidyltransferase family protein n=1 Tax=Microbacterium profundi TaxID=450380 RepID=UPI001F383E28|nr:nucleotidyltransferase family protein [Microbacterium profundi]MCE7481973.1 nucleotidyltransferase family protein [Microbacterium profundi]
MTQPHSSNLRRLLVESVRGDARGPLGDVRHLPIEAVAAAAAQHRITPAVSRRVDAAPDALEAWRRPLQQKRYEQLLRHMQASSDLQILGRELGDAGIRWALGKGPVAADLLWPAPDMREYYDVDVFIAPSDFESALKCLTDSGFTYVDRNWPELQRTMRAEIALRGPAGSHLDLHWDIAVTESLRGTFRTSVSSMLDRSTEAVLGSGTRVRVFDPEDTALHLTFHAAQNGANRLMWVADIWFATGRAEFDWDAFAERAERLRMSVMAGLVLRRVDATFGLSGDGWEPLVERNSAWDRFAGVVGRRTQFPGLPGDRHAGGMEFSSARDNLAASAMQGLVHTWTLRRIERKAARTSAPERVLYMDVDDADARTAYFEGVRRVAAGRG